MEKLQFIFEQMSNEQKREFLDTINRYHLAMSIISDKELLREEFKELFVKYPFMEDYFESQL